VFVRTLFSGVTSLIQRGAPMPEMPIYPVFSMLFYMAPATCAACDFAVSTL
jgi:hypothetical protein